MISSMFYNNTLCFCPLGELATNEMWRMNDGKMHYRVADERFAFNQVTPAQRCSRWHGDSYEPKFQMRLHHTVPSPQREFCFALAWETQVMTSSTTCWCVGLLLSENTPAPPKNHQPHSEKITPLHGCHRRVLKIGASSNWRKKKSSQKKKLPPLYQHKVHQYIAQVTGQNPSQTTSSRKQKGAANRGLTALGVYFF